VRELTLELTDYCPHSCEFCSSVAGPLKTQYLDRDIALSRIEETDAEVIHLSGGEPLAHPDFYTILCTAQAKVGAGNVRVQSCAIRWLAYNYRAVSDVRVEAYVVPQGVDILRVVKRINQGREARRPSVKWSRAWAGACANTGRCGHKVIRPDGACVRAPCAKADEIEETNDKPADE
jgi:organic radical activating enzyme